jgi:hypothetical protein
MPVKGVAESGFSFQEHNGDEPFRWTNGAAKLLVPVDAARAPQRLWVSIETFRPQATLIPFQVLVDGESLFDGKVPLGKFAVALDLSAHRFSQEAAIELKSGTFAPTGVMDGGKNTDARRLGVQVKGVMLQRDDVGPPGLEKGLTLRGRAWDQQGKPLAGMLIDARPLIRPPAKNSAGPPVLRGIPGRSFTGEQGEFCMGPLPAGEYVVAPRNPDGQTLIYGHKPRAVPDVFVSQFVRLPAADARPLEFRGLPYVTLEIQYSDPAGRPVPGFPVFVYGQLPGTHGFSVSEGGNGKGRAVLRAPKGLERATVSAPIDEHTAFRCRRSKDAPLGNNFQLELGTLTGDLRQIAIVCYRAPVLVVRASAADGRPIPDFNPRVDYPPDKAALPNIRFSVDQQGHVAFRKQDDGRWRSRFGLLPDESFTLSIKAPGYQPRSATFSLPEGAVKELDVKLKKL